MFRSQAQITIQRMQVESDMSSYFYNLMDNTSMAVDDLRDMFLEFFPGEDDFFNILLTEMDN